MRFYIVKKKKLLNIDLRKVINLYIISQIFIIRLLHIKSFFFTHRQYIYIHGLLFLEPDFLNHLRLDRRYCQFFLCLNIIQKIL